jgi:hypothetical protein
MLNIKLVSLVTIGAIAGSIISSNLFQPLNAQMVPSSQTGGDALWHLPKFGEQGWFIHAHNGKVRACNMDNASVVGDKQAPRCSSWE